MNSFRAFHSKSVTEMCLLLRKISFYFIFVLKMKMQTTFQVVLWFCDVFTYNQHNLQFIIIYEKCGKKPALLQSHFISKLQFNINHHSSILWCYTQFMIWNLVCKVLCIHTELYILYMMSSIIVIAVRCLRK